ncbi:MAG: hypothetical protein DLM72_08180 [Candidatus Nitrosopolaris wilkensis]|nr:MAG: hypothetical protein DLM72_08180 [Candidatus Nitrosopolaris wilkensis]
MSRILTIGHSNRQWNDFISLLQNNHVTVVADVRRYPGSRVCPQFNKEKMTLELMKKNIAYTHIEKLGGRGRKIAGEGYRYNNRGWQNKSFRAYADYMTTIPFKEGINEILSLIAKYDTLTIMCAEAVPWRCHRKMIADYLTMIAGVSVFNIIDSKHQPSPHKLTSFAHLTDEKLIAYPER